ncbi:glycoside hydrolase domain-containing protein [Kribbella deserti]|uniref:Glycoside hydrolase domain-containing protein n=1 Tax=Kribbella deserti TaxID=1926257 RepID=A0ABV6QU37_9ACTN
MRILRLVLPGLLLLGLTPAPAQAAPPPVWVHNASDRLFTSSLRPNGAPTSIDLYAARNETEAAQIAVRPATAVSGVFVEPSALTGPGGATIPAANINVRRAYNHPNITVPDGTVEEAPPAGNTGRYDALVENTPSTIGAGVTQPFHYSVHVPAGQPPGVYAGTATVRSSAGDVPLPVRITVYGTTLPKTNESTLKLNNWTTSAGWDYDGTIKSIPIQYGVTMYDANWWKVIENMARNHARHRNNVVHADFQALLIPNTTIDAAGNYTFGWQTFDRFIQTYVDAGAMQWIHTPHLLNGSNGTTPPKLEMLKNVNGSTQRVLVDVNTAESNAYLDKLFPALKQHLDAKGWTDKFYMSANDESHFQIDTTAANWLYGKYRQYFPKPLLNEAELKILNPSSSTTANTPIMDLYENNIGYYQRKRLAGNELWLYNCIGPRGSYLNRFLAMHLSRTRLTPMLAWKTGAVGYLHWGWNYWFEHVGGPYVQFDTFNGPQNGDNFLVRPNRPAYDVYDSLRSEAQLDGVEDYELLAQLAKTKPVLARAIANSLISSSTVYELSGEAVNQVHRQILDALASGGPDQAYPYKDDFSAGRDSWRSTRGTWSAAGGVLTQSDNTAWNHVAGLEARAYGDVAASVDVRITGVNPGGGNTNWAGLMLRNLNVNDLDSGYLVAQRNNGEVFVYRSGETIGAAQVPGYVAGQSSRLRVVARGNTISVYGGNNPKPVLIVADNAFSAGGFGLATGGASATFDNVRLNPETNPAEARPVTVSSSYDGDGWSPQAAVDGRRTTDPGAAGWTSAAAASATDAQSIQVDLGSARPVSRVDLYPRSDGTSAGRGFPIDFRIEVSADGTTWSTVADRRAYPRPSATQQAFPFAERPVRFVKVTGTRLDTDNFGTFRMQLAELEVAGGNLAAGRAVSTSSSVEYTNEGWLRSNATDGIRQSLLWNSMGWSSDAVAAGTPQSLQVDLGGPSMVGRVDLYARSDGANTGGGFPVDFTIAVSTDGSNWATVATINDQPLPGATALTWTWSQTTARYVRITGTALRPDGASGHRMQFAEVQVR